MGLLRLFIFWPLIVITNDDNFSPTISTGLSQRLDLSNFLKYYRLV